MTGANQWEQQKKNNKQKKHQCWATRSRQQVFLDFECARNGRFNPAHHWHIQSKHYGQTRLIFFLSIYSTRSNPTNLMKKREKKSLNVKPYMPNQVLFLLINPKILLCISYVTFNRIIREDTLNSYSQKETRTMNIYGLNPFDSNVNWFASQLRNRERIPPRGGVFLMTFVYFGT